MPELVPPFFADFGPLDWLLWLVGVGALVVILSPFVVAACGGTLVRFSAREDPAAVEPDGTDPEYQEKYQELTALGFRPCGVMTERVWFYTYWVYASSRVRKLVSADGRTFASLYRLGRWGVVLRVAFGTLTEKSCLVQTATPGAGLVEHHADYRRTEVPDGSLADVYARHQSEVEAATAGGAGEATATTLAELAHADERRSARTLARLELSESIFIPLYGWLVPFAVALLALGTLSGAPWSQRLGWALVFAGLCYAVLIVKVIPFLLRWSEESPGCVPCCGDPDDGEAAPEE